MKLLINYDFFDAIRNVNEPVTPLKIVRNEGKYAALTFLWGSSALIPGYNIELALKNLAVWYGVYMGIDLVTSYIYTKVVDQDKYAYNSSEQLRRLPRLLGALNVYTDYCMLLNSELYEKRYKFESSKEGLLPIKEEKYIYVPSHDWDGKEKETSILQEHYIGSGNYHLSVGEPERQYRRVLVNNHA